jgi:hypothetical protein
LLVACLAGIRPWFASLCRRESWAEAARVLAWAHRWTEPALASGSPPDLLPGEYGELLAVARNLPAVRRLALEAALGPTAEPLRRALDADRPRN